MIRTPPTRIAPRPVDRLEEGGSESASWYRALDGKSIHRACSGTACFIANGGTEPADPGPRIYCLGECFRAPARAVCPTPPEVFVHSRESVVLRRLAAQVGPSLAEYGESSDALRVALSTGRRYVLDTVVASQLRGRGGAGFPTGRKWAAAAGAEAGAGKCIVANADEGDPGAYIDRFIMEGDPHALIEGMTLAAFATGASEGWIYLRQEYPFARRALETALREARAAGLLGESILGSDMTFDIQIAVGNGSYVCGEETALLNSIMGKPPHPDARPPYATDRGLFGRPTVINNVETFATIPWIVERGAEAYRSLGVARSHGTKVLSLSSAFKRPGLHEVEFGTPARKIVEEFGGGLRSGKLKGLIIGGPLAGIIPPSLLDVPLAFEELQAIGCGVGHGGVLAFDERLPILSLLHHVFSFGAYESCGKCPPCRLGAAKLEGLFRSMLEPASECRVEEREVRDLIFTLRHASLCGHGSGLAEFAESVLTHYGKELARWWA